MEVPISTSELIKAVSVVAEKHKISGTVESNAKAEAVGTGAEQLAGDIFPGLLGVVVGTVVGALTSYYLSEGTPKSITDVINDDLTDEQREELCERIKEAFRKYGLQDLAKLIPLLTTCESFQKVVVTVLVKFLKDELNLPILDNSTAGLLLQISAK